MMLRYKKHIRTDAGFTLAETLLAVSCICAACLLIVPLVSIMTTIQKPSYAAQDRIAIASLRLLLAQSDAISFEEDTLFFTYQKKPQRLSYDRHRLVRQEGYEIFLQQVDHIKFMEQGGCIHVRWKRGQKQKQAVLVCR